MPSKIHFIHGARNSQTHAFRHEVLHLASQIPGVSIHYRYSKPLPEDEAGREYHDQGRIDMDLLKKLLGFDDYHFYICGPIPFIESLEQGLSEMNISRDRIHFEYFGKPEPKSTKAANTKPVPVTFAQSGIEIPWTPDKGSLLELAESVGIEAPYACRLGSCQTCAVKIISGEVTHDGPAPAVPDEDQALLCCARPKGSGPVFLEV